MLMCLGKRETRGRGADGGGGPGIPHHSKWDVLREMKADPNCMDSAAFTNGGHQSGSEEI